MVIGLLGLGVATYIAFVLIAVAYVLTKVSFTLGTVIIGVRSIAQQTEPVEEIVAGIAADIGAIQTALHGLLPTEDTVPRLVSRRPNAGRSRARAKPSR